MTFKTFVEFLLESNKDIVDPPVSGDIAGVFQLYKETKEDCARHIFNQYVDRLCQVTKSTAFVEVNRSKRLVCIDRLELSILANILRDTNYVGTKSTATELKALAPTSTSTPTSKSKKYADSNKKITYNMLQKVFDEANDTNDCLSYATLERCLNTKTARQVLAKECNRLTTPKKPFLEICNNSSHSNQLSNISTFQTLPHEKFSNKSQSSTNQPNVKININKRLFDALPKDIKHCVKEKIHFIPMIKFTRKSHNHDNYHSNNLTDFNLGDCSYLDTCFKLNLCRYVHYYKLHPMDELNKQIVACEKFNDQISINEKIMEFDWGIPPSFCLRDILPPQWINCDVNKFDFSVLGKFSAIVADPAWNIHMNLPYGAFNDNELAHLRLQQLQDEGVFFLWVTGRAIELGRECLQIWGYKTLNEIIWIKTNQLNRTICTGRTGHWLNHSKEHLLVGIKGNPKWLNRQSDVDLIVSSTRETSRKPDELYGIIDRLVGSKSRKLEIFGRTHNLRPNWFTIGNQLSGNSIYEKEVAIRFEAYNNKKLTH